jgi:hypothetical protein
MLRQFVATVDVLNSADRDNEQCSQHVERLRRKSPDNIVEANFTLTRALDPNGFYFWFSMGRWPEKTLRQYFKLP